MNLVSCVNGAEVCPLSLGDGGLGAGSGVSGVVASVVEDGSGDSGSCWFGSGSGCRLLGDSVGVEGSVEVGSDGEAGQEDLSWFEAELAVGLTFDDEKL